MWSWVEEAYGTVLVIGPRIAAFIYGDNKEVKINICIFSGQGAWKSGWINDAKHFHAILMYMFFFSVCLVMSGNFGKPISCCFLWHIYTIYIYFPTFVFNLIFFSGYILLDSLALFPSMYTHFLLHFSYSSMLLLFRIPEMIRASKVETILSINKYNFLCVRTFMAVCFKVLTGNRHLFRTVV